MTWLDTSAGTSGILGGEVNTGDGDLQAAAVGDWITQNGGIAGRELQLIVDRVDYGEYTANPDASMEASCRRLSEDQPVFAVGAFVPHPVFVACLARSDTLIVADTFPVGQPEYDNFPAHLYSPGTPSLEHGVVGEVDLLLPTDYFTSDPGGVGILSLDWPQFRPAGELLRATLEAHGVAVATDYYINAADAASASAAMPGAVLHFSSHGVTKLLIVDGGGFLTMSFMQSAEGQGYRPRYGLTSGSIPRVIAPLVPAAQLRRTLVSSWTPYDADADQETPPAVPDTRLTCLQIYRDAGFDLTDRNVEQSAVAICGHLLFLKAALDRAPALNSAALAEVIGGFGGSFTSPMTFQTELTPERHDGANLLRLNTWDEGCSCWQFAGATGAV